MKKKTLSVIVLFLLGFSTLSGCVTAVRTPPPQARIEVRPARPFANAVWIDGHWSRRHGDWVWISGHWVKMPRSGAAWMPGHWKKVPRGWKWFPGHWR